MGVIENLIVLRKKMGYSQEEVAEKLGITRQTYSKIENNDTQLTTRYQFLDEEGYLIAIDIFSGDLEGLAYMEIEFVNPDEAEAYGNPDWVIEDVTDDINYKNGYLARYGIPDSFYEKRRQAGLE